jgi:cation diffusion facilitator CzcD-associated flavoprotein CzcO
MRTWRTQMPPDMLLRSSWRESTMSSPGDAASIDAWAEATGRGKHEPIPLQSFLEYAEWFRSRGVRDHDEADVAHVERANGVFRVTTTSGNESDAKAVIVAVGITPFPFAPRELAPYLGDGASFVVEHQRYESFRGRKVAVVGAGQSGLEGAGLAARAGADVELIVRSHVRWFADREPSRRRSPLRERLYRLAYPVVGYGPPPLNRLVLHPDLFAALPQHMRQRLTQRVLRAGGSPWVRGLVENRVAVTEGRRVARVERSADRELRLVLDDGSVRDVEEILLATGYRFDPERLTFLAPSLRREIAVDDGFPALDRCFCSSIGGLFFVGYPAQGRIGPIARFVLGTKFAGPRVREALAA